MTRQDINNYWEYLKEYKDTGFINISVDEDTIGMANDFISKLSDVSLKGIIDNWEMLRRFKEGAEIEFKTNSYQEWHDTKDVQHLKDVIHRVKSQYEPLDFESAKTYIGVKILNDENKLYSIEAVSYNFVVIQSVDYAGYPNKVRYEDLMDNYKFERGLPVAKKK